MGFLVSAACIVLATIFLLSDFGDPWLTWRVFLNPFASIASFGACAVAAFAVVAAVEAVIFLAMPTIPPWAIWLARTAGIILAGVTMAYTGLLLAGMSSIDVWHTWLLPVLFVFSSLSCGLAALCFMEVFLPKYSTRIRPSWWRAQVVLGLLEAATLVAFLIDRTGFSATASASIESLLTGEYALGFWGGIVALGLLVPCVLHVLYPFIRVEALVMATSVSVLIGGFFLRWCVVEIALFTGSY
jgi:formate-dependent nitrite reductase membrane component NrfD